MNSKTRGIDLVKYSGLSASWMHLLQAPSLTKVLQSLDGVFTVEVQYQGLRHDNIFSKHDHISPDSMVNYYVREVFLLLNHVPVVWAASECRAEHQFWRSFLQCGNRSLGEKLFVDEQFKRSEIYFFYQQQPACPVYQSELLWSRQSCFYREAEELRLTEVFLPSLECFLLTE